MIKATIFWGPESLARVQLVFRKVAEKTMIQWFMVDITNVRIHGDYFMV